ncbi:UDP-glucuronosyltransferase 3A2 [Apodemus speciosus]|uniref:glucuronosyltransferase n=1 Tax=Apodemus speciosus TaxID=105296 RepID=A0ABQ0FJ22_APOSI
MDLENFITKDGDYDFVLVALRSVDFGKENPSYQVITWHLPEDQQTKFDNRHRLLIEETGHGRFNHHTLVKIHRFLADVCSQFLSIKNIMEFLKNENFDLVLFDSIDICSLLTVEKLGKRFVSFLPMQLSFIDFALPSAPLSYAPIFGSGLTDQMDFWGRVKNFLLFFDFSMKQREILSQYDSTIQEHFAEGSRPVLSDLLLKAELWFVNSDFALDFARPLFPNTVYVGSLLDKPVQPIPQDLENFITQFGDSGFVLVALGSIATLHQTKEMIKEMNSAFARLPQGVLWTCKDSLWPKEVTLAPNVKIMDWLPQTDLLAHPSIRLFVTHGGINSVNEAIQHGVPMVGIPFFGDQPENMVRVEAKNIGVSVQRQTLKAEMFALTMKEVIEDKRYKSAAMAAKNIRHSHPLTPAQRLVGWINHILQTGGAAHLKPYAFRQPWHEQYLLDVFLFLLGLTLGTLWLCVKVLGAVTRCLSGVRKGGSHYIVMSRVSQILHGGGHNVTKLLYENDYISGFKLSQKEDAHLHDTGHIHFLSGQYNNMESPPSCKTLDDFCSPVACVALSGQKGSFRMEKTSYQVINWSLPEDQQKKFDNRYRLLIEELGHGRYEHNSIVKIHQFFGDVCSHFLSRKDIMEFLKNENFDLVLLDSFDFCSLLTVEKLGKRFVSFFPVQFSLMDFVLPSAPLSYAPVYGSSLTDQMDFWDRVKNLLMFFDFSMKQRKILSQYDSTIQEHFAEGSRPVLSDLLLKAELWFVNSDFALDFARPLFPNTVYVGGLLDKPVQPIPQDLQNFITQFGDSGFVLVALGSVVSLHQTKEIIKEMNSAFARLPQGVLWTCKNSLWPKDVTLAPNVKIMDWLPQTDLLAHPSIRLFVTHGGMNSVNEAIQHGVPMVGIPFFGDQPENMVRVEAKNIGVSVQLQTLKAEMFALTMKEVIEDKRYKSAAMAAKIIRHSHPLTPAQRLVDWINHILQTGGAAHLKPFVFRQPWHEQYLLDVLLFLLALTLGTLWLCVKT